jgi:hypothetical protein
MTKIYEDHNGVYVRAISKNFDGNDVEGHRYDWTAGFKTGSVQFQLGPVKEAGLNGLTNEALLAILIHRTDFLNQRFPCRENETAIEFMRRALECFESRTKNRISRNVEGKNQA